MKLHEAIKHSDALSKQNDRFYFVCHDAYGTYVVVDEYQIDYDYDESDIAYSSEDGY